MLLIVRYFIYISSLRNVMKPVKYIVENERDLLWGLSINTVGYEQINKGDEYPTNKHLPNYCFSIEKGRVLQEYQLVYISEGEGFFQSESVKERIVVTGGTMFLLFPNEWHTYYPNSHLGWKQYWIGFKGINIDSRVKNGFLSKEHPIFNVGVNEEIVHLYMQAIEVAEYEKAYFQQMLAGITNHLLGLMYSLDRNNSLDQDKGLVECINRARVLMHEHIGSEFSIQDVADELGMSYSSFRKLFKKYTGLSPASYFQDIKLQKAKDLLCKTQMSVKEISYALNFESPDYFSAQFKKKTGKRPRDFRE